MNSLIKDKIKNVLSLIGLHVSSLRTQESLLEEIKSNRELLELHLSNYAPSVDSKSQLGQDIVALIVNNFKREGYFVEFGATNGYDLSNSYLLEKHFGWKGILAEPMIRWHENLKRNRKNIIDTRCVWSSSNQILDFLDVEEGEFSTVKNLAKNDHNSNMREKSKTVKVKTVSLLDLLVSNNAPRNIDYLSVDTEGSEYEILKDFDFNSYGFNFITIEHNFTNSQGLICDLLERNGYKQILQGISKWDAWFIPKK